MTTPLPATPSDNDYEVYSLQQPYHSSTAVEEPAEATYRESPRSTRGGATTRSSTAGSGAASAGTSFGGAGVAETAEHNARLAAHR
jgi:hypothetical protein